MQKRSVLANGEFKAAARFEARCVAESEEDL